MYDKLGLKSAGSFGAKEVNDIPWIYCMLLFCNFKNSRHRKGILLRRLPSFLHVIHNYLK